MQSALRVAFIFFLPSDVPTSRGRRRRHFSLVRWFYCFVSAGVTGWGNGVRRSRRGSTALLFPRSAMTIYDDDSLVLDFFRPDRFAVCVCFVFVGALSWGRDTEWNGSQRRISEVGVRVYAYESIGEHR